MTDSRVCGQLSSGTDLELGHLLSCSHSGKRKAVETVQRVCSQLWKWAPISLARVWSHDPNLTAKQAMKHCLPVYEVEETPARSCVPAGGSCI